jgi:hypothetical protein
MGEDNNIPQGEEGKFFRDGKITVISRLAQSVPPFQ